MRREIKNLLFLGVIAMGSMMLGMTSCSNDEKENGSIPVGGEKVDSVRLSKSCIGLLKGYSEVLLCKVYPNNAVNKKVIWKSVDEGIASVDSEGKVTGLKAGSTIIRCTSEAGSKSDSCLVVVSIIPKAITGLTFSQPTISGTPVELVKGVDSLFKVAIEPIDATNQFITWSVDKKGIIDLNSLYIGVTNEVYVHAKDTGSVVLTISTTDGSNKSISCNIHVNDYVKVESIKIGRKSSAEAQIENKQDTSFRFITLTTDGKENPSGEEVFYLDTIEILPANARRKKLHWSSSKESLAKLDTSGGKVKVSVKSGVGGIANIYAEAIDGSGVRDTFKVIVNHRKKVDCERKDEYGNKIPTYAVQLWASGPWWAEFNVGATIESYRNQSIPPITSPTLITDVPADDTTQLYRTTGNYFSWGGLSQYIDDSSPAHYTGDANPLPDSCDVAKQKWGDNWRMPTEDELYNLCNNTKIWVCNGTTRKFRGSSMFGYCLIGEGDYKNDTVFFPATGYCCHDEFNDVGKYGYYWSSVRKDYGNPWSLLFSSDDVSMFNGLLDYIGQSVRAVCAE